MAVGDNEQARIEFVRSTINEHRESTAYKTALDAEAYYDGLNPTINRYEKIIYDMQGRSHTDMWTANHKLASRFFGLAVDQEVSYLLGNGVTFAEKETPKKLCPDFDQEVMDAAREAKIAGVSFGFWDLTHLRVFSLLEFVPLYDEEDGAMKAGIRFWQVARDKPLRATLYEIDGFTEYFQPKNKSMEVMQEKRSYKLVIRKAEVGETEIYDGGNYPSFPIVPLKNNKRCLSEIVGKRNTIDALDLASSNMVNNVDEGNLIYWVLSNCNGMDDLDDAKFVERLKTTHVAHANGDDGAKVESKTIEAPYGDMADACGNGGRRHRGAHGGGSGQPRGIGCGVSRAVSRGRQGRYDDARGAWAYCSRQRGELDHHGRGEAAAGRLKLHAR